MKRTGIILVILIILVVSLYYTLDIKTIILRKMYPKTYSEYVYQYSEKYEVDPLLVFAIIKAESNFRPKSSSKSGAIGLMQLVVKTATEVSNQVENMETISIDALYEPNINIQLGVKYFSTLLQKYNHNIALALAAYNAGMGNVDKWIKEGIIRDDGSDIENIPYRETNNYVRKILNSYQIYQQLYQQ
ncbi:MAG: lytic transglycosylase domain-containing protein [Clostridia bacterium]|nr:lytic transglycosylase domain-containing protein [Clostridia bacterium]